MKKKAYVSAKIETTNFGKDDVVTTSFAVDLDMPGVELPDIDLTSTVKTIKAIEADNGISGINSN